LSTDTTAIGHLDNHDIMNLLSGWPAEEAQLGSGLNPHFEQMQSLQLCKSAWRGLTPEGSRDRTHEKGSFIPRFSTCFQAWHPLTKNHPRYHLNGWLTRMWKH